MCLENKLNELSENISHFFDMTVEPRKFGNYTVMRFSEDSSTRCGTRGRANDQCIFSRDNIFLRICVLRGERFRSRKTSQGPQARLL